MNGVCVTEKEEKGEIGEIVTLFRICILAHHLACYILYLNTKSQFFLAQDIEISSAVSLRIFSLRACA